MLEKLFHLSGNGTTVRREIIGGMTTFLTLSYIIFVQPALLSDPHGAGMDFGAVMTATCLASALAIFLMAFLANYPIALAPGMGHNVFFSFVVCGAMGIPWQTAMGAILISGCLFVILGAFGFRKAIMDCIPPSLKFGIAVGIGLMIALLGLEWAGLVINSEATLVTVVTDFTAPHILVSGAGLLVIMILSCYGVRGSVLLGMIASGVLAWWFGLIVYDGAFAWPPSLAPTLFPTRSSWRRLGRASLRSSLSFLSSIYSTQSPHWSASRNWAASCGGMNCLAPGRLSYPTRSAPSAARVWAHPPSRATLNRARESATAPGRAWRTL